MTPPMTPPTIAPTLVLDCGLFPLMLGVEEVGVGEEDFGDVDADESSDVVSGSPKWMLQYACCSRDENGKAHLEQREPWRHPH